jgi:hypothetical protein
MAAFGINVLFEDAESLYKNPKTWIYGEFVLTFNFHGFENLFAANSLEWMKAPLFFRLGNDSEGNHDISGSTRAQSMLLNMSDTDLPVGESSLFMKKNILDSIDVFRGRMRIQYSPQDPPRLGFDWSSVTSILGSRGCC